MHDGPLCQFLRDKAIDGDDFQQDEINAWIRDQAEGDTSLGAKNSDTDIHPYHEMNRIHGFNSIPSSRWPS